jgi:hypothetical protein
MMQGDVAAAPVVPNSEPFEAKARPVSMARGNSAGETKVEEDKSTKRVSFILRLWKKVEECTDDRLDEDSH